VLSAGVSSCGYGSPVLLLNVCARTFQSWEIYHVNASRRTFLYVTGAANRFVKVRVTLHTNDVRHPAARDFVDAIGSQLWRRTF